jgi:hypothetical protein
MTAMQLGLLLVATLAVGGVLGAGMMAMMVIAGEESHDGGEPSPQNVSGEINE